MNFTPIRRSVLVVAPASLMAFAGVLAFVAGPAAAAPTSASTSSTPSSSSTSSSSAPTTSSTTTSAPSTTNSTTLRPASPSTTGTPRITPLAGKANLVTTSALSTVNGKTATSATHLAGGDVLVYEVDVRNTGTATGTFVLTEHVPDATTYAATKTVWKGCVKGDAAGTVCTQAATLGANEEGRTTFTVQAVDPLPSGRTAISEDLSVSSGSCSSCTLSVATVASLHTKVTIDTVDAKPAGEKTHLASGDVVVYTVTVHNNGGSTGSTTVSNPVPANAKFSGSGWSCPAGSVAGTSCRVTVTLAAGATKTIAYAVTLIAYPADTKTIVDNATASAGDCTACAVTNTTVARLSTTKIIFRVNNDTVGASVSLQSGDRVVYHVTVTNTGGSSGTTTLSDTVPAHTTYVGSSQGWSCPKKSPAGTACTAKVTVPSGDEVVLHYTLLVGDTGGAASITNAVTTSAGACPSCSITSAVTEEVGLANTGVDAAGQGAIGVGLLGLGSLLAFAGRRRRQA